MWLPAVAVALAGMPTEAELFAAVLARIDQNGDGHLSREEYTRVDASPTFDAIDADRDDAVSASELGVWVTVTQPRAEDRAPSRLMSEPTPIPPTLRAPLATAPVSALVSAPVSAPMRAPVPTRTWTRVAVLTSMIAAAALAAWFLFRDGGSGRARRRHRR